MQTIKHNNSHTNQSLSQKYIISTCALTYREVMRFCKIYNQTIISPAISGFMFAIILLISSEYVDNAKVQFILTGAIASSMLQNAFGNSSSSITMSKVLSYIVDIIMPPLTSGQILFAYMMSSMLRGLIIALLMFVVVNCFVSLVPMHLGWLIAIAAMSSAMLGLLGVFTGIVTNNFEGTMVITNYIIAPLSMLSGTFYSVDKLPATLQMINQFNPFFYMIDGFRYANLGLGKVDIQITCGVLLASNLMLCALLYIMLRRGYGIKQ